MIASTETAPSERIVILGVVKSLPGVELPHPKKAWSNGKWQQTRSKFHFQRKRKIREKWIVLSI